MFARSLVVPLKSLCSRLKPKRRHVGGVRQRPRGLVPVRRDHVRGAVGGVQVPAQQPLLGGDAVGFGLLRMCPLGRVYPKEFVEPVPIRLGRLQQVGVDQALEGVGDESALVLGCPSERDRRRQADGWTLPESEQPEQPGRIDLGTGSAGCRS